MHRPRITRRQSAPAMLLLLSGFAFVIAGCGGGVAATIAPTSPAATPSPAAATAASISTVAVSPGPVVTASPQPAVTTPPVTDPPITPPPATAPPPSTAPGIGTKLQIGDQQFMTVMAAEQWPGTSTVKPRTGKAFFTVSIRIDAITVTSFDSADFKLKDAAGHFYAWRTGRAPHLYNLDGMNPGSTYTAWVTYEVPKTSVAQLTLIYKPSFMGGLTYRVPLF